MRGAHAHTHWKQMNPSVPVSQSTSPPRRSAPSASVSPLAAVLLRSVTRVSQSPSQSTGELSAPSGQTVCASEVRLPTPLRLPCVPERRLLLPPLWGSRRGFAQARAKDEIAGRHTGKGPQVGRGRPAAARRGPGAVQPTEGRIAEPQRPQQKQRKNGHPVRTKAVTLVLESGAGVSAANAGDTETGVERKTNGLWSNDANAQIKQ
jgi:hypothetical protein